MAEALTARGLQVTQLEQLPEVLPTVDPDLGALVHAELAAQRRRTSRARRRGGRHPTRRPSGPAAAARGAGDRSGRTAADLSGRHGARRRRGAARHRARRRGRRPARRQAGHRRRPPHADQPSRMSSPPATARSPITACSGRTYLPLGTTAHKQGRVAGENALGGSRHSPAVSGPRSSRSLIWWRRGPGCATTKPASAALTRSRSAHKPMTTRRYYPGSHPIAMRYTGDQSTGRLLGVQLFGLLGSRDRQAHRYRRHCHRQRDDDRRHI